MLHVYVQGYKVFACCLVIVSLAVGGLAATFNVVDYGAKGDNITDNVKVRTHASNFLRKCSTWLNSHSTQAFQDAWNAACAAGGSSTVLVPGGSSFLLSYVIFNGPCKSQIHLRVFFRLISMVGYC